MTKFISPAPAGWFVRGWIPGEHRGTDFGWYNADVSGSRRVVVVAPGEVVSESVGGDYNDGWGNQYIIDHGHGIFTTYNHLETGTMQLDVGQRVEAGTYVGQMGNTGKTNGETHLHFEVRINGSGADNRVDPAPWLDGSQEIPDPDQPLAPNQRRVIPDGEARRRIGSPSTSAPQGDPLPAGEIGNFKGWVRGENANGSNVWFVGISGDFFHSSGFVGGANTEGLPDLNAPALQPNQRRVLASDTANRRIGAPSTASPAGSALAPATVVDLNGWIHGEAVSGNDVWFFAQPNDFFWSGGFDGGADVSGLADLNQKKPQRTVSADSKLRARSGPWTSFAVSTEIPAGAVVDILGWAKGESVSGNDTWFLSAQGWSWSGGFTSTSTADIPAVDAPKPPAPPAVRTPTYPAASKGYIAPLGEKRSGAPVTKLIIHHTATTADQLDYFLSDNDRASCPNWYARATGEILETIAPALRPSSTKGANDTSVAIETQNTSGAPQWGISHESMEAIAQLAAWLSKQTVIEGVPFAISLDRQHIVGHREVPGNSTECPGPSMDLDWIVARAKEIVGSKPEPEPEITLTVDFVKAQLAAAEAVAAAWKELLP